MSDDSKLPSSRQRILEWLGDKTSSSPLSESMTSLVSALKNTELVEHRQNAVLTKVASSLEKMEEKVDGRIVDILDSQQAAVSELAEQVQSLHSTVSAMQESVETELEKLEQTQKRVETLLESFPLTQKDPAFFKYTEAPHVVVRRSQEQFLVEFSYSSKNGQLLLDFRGDEVLGTLNYFERPLNDVGQRQKGYLTLNFEISDGTSHEFKFRSKQDYFWIDGEQVEYECFKRRD